MATSTLVVYEPLDSFGEQSEYWLEYSKFYEQYWGGPTSPFGVWFGNEYENYRKALSMHLNLDDDEIRDCFFLKKGDEDYFIAPLADSNNIFSFENSIPHEWFLLFHTNERKNFYTHWGFNTIHYDADLGDAKKRLEEAGEIIGGLLASEEKISFSGYLSYMNEGIDNLKNWINNFSMGGFIVLNYGDICSHIHLLTLKNEKSVDEYSNFLNLLEQRKIEEADIALRIFSQKWEEIRRRCEGDPDSELLQ